MQTGGIPQNLKKPFSRLTQQFDRDISNVFLLLRHILYEKTGVSRKSRFSDLNFISGIRYSILQSWYCSFNNSQANNNTLRLFNCRITSKFAWYFINGGIRFLLMGIRSQLVFCSWWDEQRSMLSGWVRYKSYCISFHSFRRKSRMGILDFVNWSISNDSLQNLAFSVLSPFLFRLKISTVQWCDAFDSHLKERKEFVCDSIHLSRTSWWSILKPNHFQIIQTLLQVDRSLFRLEVILRYLSFSWVVYAPKLLMTVFRK